jgi:hypothetical protein
VCAIRRPFPRFPLVVLLSSSRLSSSLFLSPPHLCSVLRELVVSVSDIYRGVLTLYLEPRFTLATSNTRPRKKIQSETSNNACHWPSAARRVFEVPQLPAWRNCHIVVVPTRSVALSCAPGYFVATTLTRRRLSSSSSAARLPSCLSLPLSELDLRGFILPAINTKRWIVRSRKEPARLLSRRIAYFSVRQSDFTVLSTLDCEGASFSSYRLRNLAVSVWIKKESGYLQNCGLGIAMRI